MIKYMLFVAALTVSCGFPKPNTVPAAGSVIYTAVGASDASGVGSSRECLPFADCSNGMGYVPVTARTLAAKGQTVSTFNLGIPTTVIGPDFAALGASAHRIIIGNMLTNEVPFIPPHTTLVTVFAGVNEIDTITAAVASATGDPGVFIDDKVHAFAADYATLLAGIRARTGRPRIVVLNVPNPAGLPFLAGASAEKRAAAQRAAVGMTQAVNALPNVTVVDLMCDARTYLAENYSSDGMHPNDAGYAFMASEIVKAITADAYPLPLLACRSMEFQ